MIQHKQKHQQNNNETRKQEKARSTQYEGDSDTRITVKSYDIEEALEHTGFGRFNVFFILTCGLILLAVNSESYSVGFILPAAECDLNLTVKEKSILTSIGFIGIMSSQFIWGFVADSMGRRGVLFYTLATSFLCTVAATFAPYFWLFVFFRFLNGVMIACSSATVFAYLGEFMSNKHRSSSITSASIFTGLAITAIPAAAWIFLTSNMHLQVFNFTFLSWRFFVLICGVPSVLACAALFFFPESPKFLYHIGKLDEALAVLKKIHDMNTPKQEFAVKTLHKEGEIMHTNKNRNVITDFFALFFSLFHLKYLKNTILACLLQFGIFATSSGLLLWYPDILLRIAKSGGDVTVCSAMEAVQRQDSGMVCGGEMDPSIFEQNLFIGCFYLFGFVTISLVINIVGIKTILVVFLGTASISAALLYFVTNHIIIDILFIVLLVLSGLCVSVVNAAVVDLFPTNLRAMAVCIAMFSGRLGSVTASSVLGYLLEWNCNATFFMYALNLFCCAILALFIPRSRTT